jgi:small GTP-binding protein
MRILFLGLDNAGKTTVLNALTGKEGEQTLPTIGFKVGFFRFDNLEFVVWDVSGQDRLRPFWRHYYRGTAGVVFVVDASDRDRVPLVRKELQSILKEAELEFAVWCILANKSDMPNPMSKVELRSELGLDTSGKEYCVFETVATTGSGIKDAITWLSEHMKPL